MKIFLSYASEEATKAEEIQLALTADGHDVFFDRTNLPAGGDYNTRIRTAIKESVGMIFLISPHSVEKGSYALTELKFAREKWRHPRGCVLPVMAEPTDYDKIPVFLRAVTVLEPEGNIAAEVAAAVQRLPLGNWRVDIVHTLSTIEQDLHANQRRFMVKEESRRKDVSAYFKKISKCLDDVHSSLARDEVPHGSCAELEGYAELLPETVGDYLGKEKSEELSDLLKASHEVEGLWEEFNASPEKKSNLPVIKKTAGRFTALANSVEAGL
ncbi:MAG: toll/interleukin-1 receptor domain-containing protein [Desulfobacterales bacterium]|jgi:hypothetical protein